MTTRWKCGDVIIMPGRNTSSLYYVPVPFFARYSANGSSKVTSQGRRPSNKRREDEGIPLLSLGHQPRGLVSYLTETIERSYATINFFLFFLFYFSFLFFSNENKFKDQMSHCRKYFS